MQQGLRINWKYQLILVAFLWGKKISGFGSWSVFCTWHQNPQRTGAVGKNKSRVVNSALMSSSSMCPHHALAFSLFSSICGHFCERMCPKHDIPRAMEKISEKSEVHLRVFKRQSSSNSFSINFTKTS